MRYRWYHYFLLFLLITGFLSTTFNKVVEAADSKDININCTDPEKRRAMQYFRGQNDILYYDECSNCSTSGDNSAGATTGGAGADCAATPLPDSVPAYWKNLIDNAAAKYPDTDRRAVAATLWVENRGWPDPNKKWAQSPGAGARGPWQFIPSSWASMGVDCNGDGVKNIEDPEDEVCAAFVHLKGTACKPIMTGATGDAQADYDNVPYKDEGNNTILSAIQHYNGSGAKSGVPLAQQPHNQNGEYIQMAYWLIASDFKTSYNAESDQKGDATKSGSAAANDASAATNPSGGEDSSAACSSAANQSAGSASIVQIGDFRYAFPVVLPKNDVVYDPNKSWPCVSNCHHDGTAAFDLSKKAADDSTTGTPVVAIIDGEIVSFHPTYKGHDGCPTWELKGVDGFIYWYGHNGNATIQEGSKVSVGQQIGQVGRRECTGNNSYPHLHIDRGGKGTLGGSINNRDSGIIPLINELYDKLPGGGTNL
jgi:hypothetical protein